MQTKKEKGRIGEDAARVFLLGQGYAIEAANVRTPFGELDLVARYPNILVFVEVKYRRSLAFGRPEEALTRRKLAHLANCIAWYLDRFSVRGPYRLDVIAIVEQGQMRTIRHIKGVGVE